MYTFIYKSMCCLQNIWREENFERFEKCYNKYNDELFWWAQLWAVGPERVAQRPAYASSPSTRLGRRDRSRHGLCEPLGGQQHGRLAAGDERALAARRNAQALFRRGAQERLRVSHLFAQVRRQLERGEERVQAARLRTLVSFRVLAQMAREHEQLPHVSTRLAHRQRRLRRVQAAKEASGQSTARTGRLARLHVLLTQLVIYN